MQIPGVAGRRQISAYALETAPGVLPERRRQGIFAVMRLEHEELNQLKKMVKTSVGKRLDLSHYRLFFFGSRVQGRASEGSDIDLGIEGPKPVPGYIMEDLREEIKNLPVLYSIDIVDFSTVSKEFRREALRAIEPIT